MNTANVLPYKTRDEILMPLLFPQLTPKVIKVSIVDALDAYLIELTNTCPVAKTDIQD